ncbi:hypothetical protein CCYS_06740 [Corynebacterium cystitidis DSM 20524]|uniref:Uncharacterized protein n=1 Tax=Corynebacterium cystitidis DSM 20524 TaxID=1121357 RepID=A0A1H9VCJ9_9CORY|nr:hypothetical protein [Corynebacterium cystitidis]WJY82277.1 hypothetical protein CCYS_06740 [Corynebacterium cystitidis DSM 20524]SES19520.1 hypothetical protein SAMN05661109_02194 [Corynebacterium cystitidis DSM 20524]SNV76965.1 transposase [Corynebacterium cystitidis]
MIVMPALAISRMMENATGLSIKRLVRTLKKYRNFELNINGQTIHAAIPLPPDVQNLINKIKQT